MEIDWDNVRMTYNFPTHIRFGAGVSEELAQDLALLSKDGNVFIVTDPGIAKLPLMDNLKKSMQLAGVSFEVFSDLSKNPNKADVKKGVAVFLQQKYHTVVGVGGGAAMDTARAIALWAYHPENDLFDFDDLKGGDRFVVNQVPELIMIPTTSGTGSEVGRSAVISDDESHEKKVLFAPSLLAKSVYVDPLLSLQLPASITATTGIDALVHNLEAYLTPTFSPLCDGIALEGIKLVAESLMDATWHPNIQNRSKMAMASLMGATAFQKGLGVIHSMAHSLSAKFDTHHGLAVSLALLAGLEFNQPVITAKLNTLERYLGDLMGESTSFIEWIGDLKIKLKIPPTLSTIESDISDEDIAELAKFAFQDGCHQSNAKKVSLSDFENLFKRIL